MVFWILIGLVAAATLFTFVMNVGPWGNDFWESVGYSLGIMCCAALAAFVAFLIAAGVLGNDGLERKFVGDHTEKLRALDTGSGIEGRSYFLGGGYLGSTRVLNYITMGEDGYVRLASADARVSAVKEDADAGTARVKVYEVEETQYNLWPWPGRHYQNYEFHVPAGSVVEGYKVDNK